MYVLDFYRGDPSRIVCGAPDEQPAFPHAPLEPKPPLDARPPRALGEAEILAMIRARMAEIRPLVGELAQLERAAKVLQEIQAGPSTKARRTEARRQTPERGEVMRTILATRKGRIAAATATLALCSSLAFAAWTATGQGGVLGHVASMQPVTLTHEGVTPTKFLRPGSTADGYTIVTNPADNGPLTLTSATPVNLPQIVPGTGSGCSTANFTATGATGLSIALPAGASTPVTLPNVWTLAASAPDGCQGAKVMADFTITAVTP